MMNREIKFRAWTGKIMMPVLMIDFESKIMCIDKELVEDTGSSEQQKNALLIPKFCNLNDYPVMQYTGRKDKNNQEIYEGHIIDLIDWARYVIYWDEEGFWGCDCIERIGTEPFMFDSELILHTDRDKIKIIGNKFENPELLKEEKSK